MQPLRYPLEGAEVAQSVEHATENRGVASSILALSTTIHAGFVWQRPRYEAICSLLCSLLRAECPDLDSPNGHHHHLRSYFNLE